MKLIKDDMLRFAIRGKRYTFAGLSFLAVLFFLTVAPTTAQSSVTTDKDSLYTAYRTETADVIKARSGSYHIVTDRTVIVETSSGAVAVTNGEAKIAVTPHYVRVESLENTTFIQTRSGTTAVAEGQTVQLKSRSPKKDPILTSLGMCE